MARERKQDLSWSEAIWNAFWAREIEYFPRLSAHGTVVTLNSEEILEEISANTAHLLEYKEGNEIKGRVPHTPSLTNDFVKAALERGRESLDEVKSLTEYQDQKATRLLIVASFLSALSGLLFGRFIQEYPVPVSLAISDWQGLLVAVSYLVFFLFVLSAVSGALVIFHATRMRFKFPQPDPSRRRNRTCSFPLS